MNSLHKDGWLTIRANSDRLDDHSPILALADKTICFRLIRLKFDSKANDTRVSSFAHTADLRPFSASPQTNCWLVSVVEFSGQRNCFIFNKCTRFTSLFYQNLTWGGFQLGRLTVIRRQSADIANRLCRQLFSWNRDVDTAHLDADAAFQLRLCAVAKGSQQRRLCNSD